MRERVWDEGYEVGYKDAIFEQRGLSTDSDADQYPHENPYRGLESADIDLADAPMPDSVTPEWGAEDYGRHAVLFNDITHCRTQQRLIFSDRLRLQRHLWTLGWRRDVRDEDVTERTEEQP